MITKSSQNENNFEIVCKYLENANKLKKTNFSHINLQRCMNYVVNPSDGREIINFMWTTYNRSVAEEI